MLNNQEFEQIEMFDDYCEVCGAFLAWDGEDYCCPNCNGEELE